MRGGGRVNQCSAVRDAEEEEGLETQSDEEPDATAAGPVGLPGGAAETGVGRAGIGCEWGVFLGAHLGVMSTIRIMGLNIFGNSYRGIFCWVARRGDVALFGRGKSLRWLCKSSHIGV
jgi:hypothetical protein